MQKILLYLSLLCILISCRKREDSYLPTIKNPVSSHNEVAHFSQSEYKMLIGDTLILKLEFADREASTKLYTWDLDTSVVKITFSNDSIFKLVGLAEGSVTVNVSTKDSLITASTTLSIGYPIVKKLLWLGTSITEGCSYPKNSSTALGYSYINKAIGASGICINNGILKNGRDGKDLSETMAEKKARYEGYVTNTKLEEFYNYSYERAVLPYLDQVEVIIFDHGYNDKVPVNESLQNLDWNSYDRHTYIGAFNYLLREIKKRKPSIRIIIAGYFENHSPFNIRGGKVVCSMQDSIAKHYNFPLLDVWNYSGLTYSFVPNTMNYIKDFNAKYKTNYSNFLSDAEGNITDFQIFCPDTVHPFTDLTGVANRKLDSIYIDLLGKVLSTF